MAIGVADSWRLAMEPLSETRLYYKRVSERLGMPSIDSFYRLSLIPGLEHCFNGVGEINVGQYLHHYKSDDPSKMFCSCLSTGLRTEPGLRQLPDYQMMGPRREYIAVIHRRVHGMGRSIYAGRSVENTSESVCVTVNCMVVLVLMKVIVLSDAFTDSKENVRIDMRV